MQKEAELEEEGVKLVGQMPRRLEPGEGAS